jgi:hypothetical protein
MADSKGTDRWHYYETDVLQMGVPIVRHASTEKPPHFFCNAARNFRRGMGNEPNLMKKSEHTKSRTTSATNYKPKIKEAISAS